MSSLRLHPPFPFSSSSYYPLPLSATSSMDFDPIRPPPDPTIPAVDLEFDFQSLNLSHNEEIQIDLGEPDQEQVTSSFNLLFKVGPPDGKASRNISIFVFERAMRAAWGNRFYKVEQLVDNIFMVQFRSEEDLIWVWQRQPWLVERETMLVEYVDPKGSRPKESLAFRYLPVNVHLYGIPKSLRSIDLVDKIIGKIGVKDSSVPFSENSMFRVAEYVLARVVLDVTKPLLDSITINISKEKKIKVYIHYEKLVKICNFCGHLFHNVASCNKRHEFIMNLSPTEAAKVPEQIYGKWRTLEHEIPMEAREEKENRSQNAFIQSFREFFQKSSGTPFNSEIKGQSSKELEIFSNNSSSKQIVLSSVQHQSEFNATGAQLAGCSSRFPEGPGHMLTERQEKEVQGGNNIFISQTAHAQMGNTFPGQGWFSQGLQEKGLNNQITVSELQNSNQQNLQNLKQQECRTKLQNPENLGETPLRPRRRNGNHCSRWDQDSSGGDNIQHQYNQAAEKQVAHGVLLNQVMAPDGNQDRGGNRQHVRANNDDLSVQVHDHIQTEDAREEAQDTDMPMDGETQLDDSSLPDGAMAPALKAPRAP
ncbi:hypothetical protein EJB05_35420, partial [Eragrostis curvula]